MEIISSSSADIEGPIFFSKHALLELSSRLVDIDSLLTDLMEKDVAKEVDRLREKSYNAGKPDVEIRSQAIPSAYNNQNRVTAYSRDGYTIDLEDIATLVKHDTLKKYKISAIAIEIKRGTRSFKLQLRHSMEKSISYETSGLIEDEKREVKFKISEWIDTVLPKPVLKYWSKISTGMQLFSIVMFALALVAIFATVSNSDAYFYRKEIRKTMIDQIESNESNEAAVHKSLNLLLMYSADYVPKNYKRPNIDLTIGYFLILISVGIFLLSFCPKTCFELGKERTAYKIQVAWSRMVVYTIPVMVLLPIVINYVTK